MTSHFLVNSLNNGLTRIFKDISSRYENVDFKDLSERYLVHTSQKKPKRKGHVSAYNIFVRETRPSIVAENPNLSFSEIAAQVSKRWKLASKDPKRMADLNQKKSEYVKSDDSESQAVVQPVVVPEPVKAPEPVVSQPTKEKKQKKGGKTQV